jgi:hypothetical protein
VFDFLTSSRPRPHGSANRASFKWTQNRRTQNRRSASVECRLLVRTGGRVDRLVAHELWTRALESYELSPRKKSLKAANATVKTMAKLHHASIPFATL